VNTYKNIQVQIVHEVVFMYIVTAINSGVSRGSYELNCPGIDADPSGRSIKGDFCGRSFAGVAISNSAGGMDICVVCLSKDTKAKGRMQDNEDKETSTDEVECTKEYKKKKTTKQKQNPLGGEIFRICLEGPWDPPSLL
jgi:hypothetical protein